LMTKVGGQFGDYVGHVGPQNVDGFAHLGFPLGEDVGRRVLGGAALR
jgi:hypothetical protein